MTDGIEAFEREADLISCEVMALRDWLDTEPMLAEVFTSMAASPWRDAASIVLTDLLKHRGDRVRLLTRLYAWDAVIHERHKL